MIRCCVTIAALAVFAAVTQRAEAGAWPRERGQSFASVSVESPLYGLGGGRYASLYYEYGLTERTTLGLDMGRDDQTGEVSAILFLRQPLGATAGRNLWAFELGAGVTGSGGLATLTLRPGLSWGRGYQAAWASGWMGVESTYAMRLDGSTLGKVDTTFGVSHRNGSLSMLKVQYEKPSGQSGSIAIAPAVALKLGRRGFLELGLRHRPQDRATLAKVGIWIAF